MSWQMATRDAEKLAAEIEKNSTERAYTLVEFESDEAFRSAHPQSPWSRDYHNIVMRALYRRLDRRGFKITRVKSGTE